MQSAACARRAQVSIALEQSASAARSSERAGPSGLEHACSEASTAADAAAAALPEGPPGAAAAQELGRALSAAAEAAPKRAAHLSPAERGALASLCESLLPAAQRACGVAPQPAPGGRKGGAKRPAGPAAPAAPEQPSPVASALASAALVGFAAAEELRCCAGASPRSEAAETESTLRGLLASPLLSDSALTRAGGTVCLWPRPPSPRPQPSYCAHLMNAVSARH